LNVPDDLSEIIKRTGDFFRLDEISDNRHSQMRLPHSAGSDIKEPNILDGIILDKLSGNLKGIPVGIVMDLKVFQAAVLIPPGDVGLFEKRLILEILKTLATPG
jgi:hypothetical protein